MRRFEYVRPLSLQEAAAFLDDHADQALVLAGGTAAVSLMSQGLLRPGYVLDIGSLSELKGLEAVGGGLRIGALTPIADLQRSALVNSGYRLLAEAASQVASIRVRNVATAGGSCCYGEPQADLPPALLAMGATAHIVGSKGSRTLPLQDFFQGPYETALEPGELLAELHVPEAPEGSGGCHQKFTIGSRANKPVANVSCFLRVEGGRVADARIVMGAVGPVPTQAVKAADLLIGGAPDGERIAAAAGQAAEEADPIEDLRGPVWYKRHMVKVLTERAIRGALARVPSPAGRGLG